MRCRIPILQNLTKLDDDYSYLEGTSFERLPKDIRRQFENFQLTYFKIPEETPIDVVFSIYEDINSGGVEMSSQSIRRALFRGAYISLLDELSENQVFKKIWSPATEKVGYYRAGAKNLPLIASKEMKSRSKEEDRELILLLLALRNNDNRYKGPLKSFLNNELKRVNDLPPSLQEKELNNIKEEFSMVMKTSYEIWGENAFHKWEYR